MIELTEKQYWQLNDLLPEPIRLANIDEHKKSGEYTAISPITFRIRQAKGVKEKDDLIVLTTLLANGTPLFFRGRKKNAIIVQDKNSQ